MGLMSWLAGKGWRPPREDGRNFFDDFDDMMRGQDPDYDRRRAVERENAELRARRHLLAQEEQNIVLRREIAELEKRRQQRGDA